jgi:MFS family permease
MSYVVSAPLPQSRTGFLVATFGSLAMMASASAPSPFYPVLRAEIGFSPALMTVVFAVYALALLSALLIAGSASDHVGRRPVLSLGFALLALALFVFDQATSVSGLILARILQGAACGLLVSTLPATITDFEPRSRPGLAAVINTVVPLLGLALGALVSGFFLDLSATPQAYVFGGFVAVSVVFALAIWLFPETAPRHAGFLASLRPRVGVPVNSRKVFWSCAPALFASWATGGLYLSLGASIVAQVFGIRSAIPQGLVITLLAGMGALACLVAQKRTGRGVILYGTATMSIGTAICLVALWVGSLPLYLAALAFAGTGFGTCFFGVLRTVVPTAAPDERAELFSSIFTLSYLSFSVPSVIAGMLVPVVGLKVTVTLYGAVVIAGAATAGLLRWRKGGV